MTTPRGGAELMARLRELARFSAEPDAMTRLYLTPEHKQAAAQVDAWMREAGMSVHIDAVGTVVGRYEGLDPGRAGAAARLAHRHRAQCRQLRRQSRRARGHRAVRRLNAAGERLPFAIEVLAFGDEEGVRFPGNADRFARRRGHSRRRIARRDGRRRHHIREALARLRLRPGGDRGHRPRARRRCSAMSRCTSSRVRCWRARTCRSASSPPSAARAAFRVKVKGVAGHAGTVPMVLRQRRLARRGRDGAGGRAPGAGRRPISSRPWDGSRFQPGAVNVIPSVGRFTLDCRSSVDAVRVAGMASLEKAFEAIARRRGVTVTVRSSYEEPAAVCSPGDRRGARSRRSPRRACGRCVCPAARATTAWPWGALPHRHALRALQGRHQPQPAPNPSRRGCRRRRRCPRRLPPALQALTGLLDQLSPEERHQMTAASDAVHHFLAGEPGRRTPSSPNW